MIDWTKPARTKNGYSIKDIKPYQARCGKEMMRGSVSVKGEIFILGWDRNTGMHLSRGLDAVNAGDA